MYKVQVNKAVLRNHLHYDWWKYFVGAIATILLWSMVTTIARPQIPPEQRVEIFIVGGFVFEDALGTVKQGILEDFPELLEIRFSSIMLTDDPQTEFAGRQKLMVMVGSQTGDIFVFEREEFEVFAEMGAFIPLDEVIDDKVKAFIPIERIEAHRLAAKTMDQQAGTPYIYGLPLDGVEIFEDAGLNVENKVIAVMSYSRNTERAVEVMKWILTQDRL